eukprot:416306_1
MKLSGSVLFIFLVNLISLAFSGCGYKGRDDRVSTGSKDDHKHKGREHRVLFEAGTPTLGLTIKSGNSDYKSDATIKGRIYTTQDGWTSWRKLDNSGCGDFDTGTDYFKDFDNVHDPWKAIALYNCDNDGYAFTSITYWDGNSHETRNTFCGDIGPSTSCGVCKLGAITLPGGRTTPIPKC